MAKYKNIKTTVDNIVFHSKKEAEHYQKLKLLERAGKIRNLRLQPRFLLIPKQVIGDFVEKPVVYIADFEYVLDDTDDVVVVDVKGVKTKDYIIKRKLMLQKFGIRVTEI